MLFLSVHSTVLKRLCPLQLVGQPTSLGRNYAKTVVLKRCISKRMTLSIVDRFVIFLYFMSALSPRLSLLLSCLTIKVVNLI